MMRPVPRQTPKPFQPSRVLVAWAFIGAGAAICSMYSFDVYYDGTWVNCNSEAKADGGHAEGRVRVFNEMIYEGRRSIPIGWRIVDCYYGAAVCGFAVIGGTVAATFGRIIPRRFRRPQRKSLLTLVTATGVVTLLLVKFGVPGVNGGSIGNWIDLDNFWKPNWASQFERKLSLDLLKDVLILVGVALPFGWAFQVIVVSLVAGIVGRPDQADDYDDAITGSPKTVQDSIARSR